jgi:hypothetical protein
VIALWKDPSTGVREIPLEAGAHAVLLTRRVIAGRDRPGGRTVAPRPHEAGGLLVLVGRDREHAARALCHRVVGGDSGARTPASAFA